MSPNYSNRMCECKRDLQGCHMLRSKVIIQTQTNIQSQPPEVILEYPPNLFANLLPLKEQEERPRLSEGSQPSRSRFHQQGQQGEETSVQQQSKSSENTNTPTWHGDPLHHCMTPCLNFLSSKFQHRFLLDSPPMGMWNSCNNSVCFVFFKLKHTCT